MESGIEVRVWFVGLNTPEPDITRVRSRVEKAGQDIPETKVRERYHREAVSIWSDSQLAGLRVYNNSEEADPHSGAVPEPILIVHLDNGKIVNSCDLTTAPNGRNRSSWRR